MDYFCYNSWSQKHNMNIISQNCFIAICPADLKHLIETKTKQLIQRVASEMIEGGIKGSVIYWHCLSVELWWHNDAKYETHNSFPFHKKGPPNWEAINNQQFSACLTSLLSSNAFYQQMTGAGTRIRKTKQKNPITLKGQSCKSLLLLKNDVISCVSTV